MAETTFHPYWRTARVEIAPEEWVDDCWQRDDGLTMIPDPRNDKRWAVFAPGGQVRYPDDLVPLTYSDIDTVSDIHYALDAQYPWTPPEAAPMPESETNRYALLFEDD